MPTYLHECQACKVEFEDFYSTTAPLPPCPTCQSPDVKRLICGTSKGVVELTGNELTAKLKEDGIKLRNEAAKNENVMANLVGETKYQQNVKAREYVSSLFRRKS